MRKKKAIKIFGEDCFLFERSFKDISSLYNLMMDEQKNPLAEIWERAITIVDSLKYNIYELKWYQIFKRIRYKRKFRTKYIFKWLGYSTEAVSYVRQIYELEGMNYEDIEKKKTTLNEDSSPP